MDINSSPRPIECLDFNKNVFAATTLNQTTVWHKKYELDVPYLEPVMDLNGSNKCLRISPETDRLVLGRYNEQSRTALRLVDLESYVSST